MADLHSIPNEFIRALSDFPTNDMPRTSGSFSSVTHTHPTALLELTHTITDTGSTVTGAHADPPPSTKFSPCSTPTPTSMMNPVSTRHHRSSVHSAASSIISNAPSTKLGSFTPEASSDPTRRPTKLERLLCKLVPRKHITSVSIPTPKRASCGRTGSVARLPVQPDDMHPPRVLDQRQRERKDGHPVPARTLRLSPPAQDAPRMHLSDSCTPMRPAHPCAPRFIIIRVNVNITLRRRHRGPRPTPPRNGGRLPNWRAGLPGGKTRQTGGESTKWNGGTRELVPVTWSLL